MGLGEKIFGTHSQHEIKRILPIVDKIEAMRPDMQKLSDEELRAKTPEFKERLQKGETLDDILPEAYAVVREGAKRAIGLEHFRVQLIGGIILHQGRIAEMRTGEGKTLVSTLPAYLNALEGKGVHIVTVNDYLAKRDSEWMGRVHEFLGLTVGVVLNDMSKEERQAAYNCDITYITNNELGFDYLRDNMAVYEKNIVQRGLHYCIIDEVDSVLIDEARTPLIISGQSGKSTKLYEMCDVLARQLTRGEDLPEFSKIDAIMGVEQEETGDYIVNEKDKTVNLTQEGIKKTEQFFKIQNLADPENLEIQHNVILALRAHNLMHRDQDYVVKDGQVLIVDDFTGRILPGRRYSDGLHQAIEAKEHVPIKRESMTLATITFQNFFNKDDKKAGMTGTALTEEQEFRDIYGMDVIEIPTNKPVARIDKDDAVYKTKAEKYKAVVEEVKESHAKGQPVLVGTITIDVSELLSKMLSKEGIKHEVLNAKFHEKEAAIIAQAGMKGAVTIATNMAGRGTDILLGGNPERLVDDYLKKAGVKPDSATPEDREEALKKAKADCDSARDEVVKAGGLKVIGTERHESRRIDNQLRGRAGRQGDPGESQFFISLEDDLMRLFGSEKMMSVFEALGVPEGEQIHHKMLSAAIERAQKKIEENNFGIRKNLLEYDQVMNDQRELVYAQRKRVLEGEDMKPQIMDMIETKVSDSVELAVQSADEDEKWNLVELNRNLRTLIPLPPITPDSIKDIDNADELKEKLTKDAKELYDQRESEAPSPELVREIERVVLLRCIDKHWMEEIDDMDQLRQGIGLQAYGQRNPVDEYKMQSYDMMDQMNDAITTDTVGMLFHVRIEQKETERKEVAQPTSTNMEEKSESGPKKRKGKKIYPNDPCPCGSGKKYKNCHGRPGMPPLPNT